jgi:hypothetical protein
MITWGKKEINMTQTKVQYWQSILQQQSESGFSKPKFCKHHGIHLSTFYAWANKLKSGTEPQQQKILPVHLSSVPVAISTPSTPTAELTLLLANGHRLSFSADLSAAQLQQYVAALT